MKSRLELLVIYLYRDNDTTNAHTCTVPVGVVYRTHAAELP